MQAMRFPYLQESQRQSSVEMMEILLIKFLHLQAQINYSREKDKRFM